MHDRRLLIRAVHLNWALRLLVVAHHTLIHFVFRWLYRRDVIARWRFWLAVTNDVWSTVVSKHKQILRTDLLLFAWVSRILVDAIILDMFLFLISIFLIVVAWNFLLLGEIYILVEDGCRWLGNLSLAPLLVSIRSLIPDAVSNFLVKLWLFWLIFTLKFGSTTFTLVFIVIVQIQLTIAIVVFSLKLRKLAVRLMSIWFGNGI